MTHYNTLGVAENATPDELKSAYKKLAMEFHPDRNPGNKEYEEKFKNINAAYDTLKDPQKRAGYDHERKYGGQQGGHPFGFHQSGNGTTFHFNFGGGGPGGFDINEIFANMGMGPQRNRDLNVNYPMTLEEMHNGKEAEIRYIVPGEGNKTKKIQIPPGVGHGAKMRHQGEGCRDNKKLPPGDFYVTITQEPHQLFERQGDNLVMRYKIDALNAMLGVEREFTAIDGSTVKVKIEPASQHGTVMRIKGKGMRVYDSKNVGDLFIELQITVPTLTEEQKEHIRNCL